MHQSAEVTHLACGHRPGVAVRAESGFDPLVDLRADTVPDRPDGVVVTQQGRGAGRRHLRFIGDDQGQAAHGLLHPIQAGVVDVGEERDLPHQIQVHLGHQVIFRGEVGVGRRGCDLGAGSHRPHRQIGVRRLAESVPCGDHQFVERLLLPRPAPVLGGGHHGVPGHMSNVVSGAAPTQAPVMKKHVLGLIGSMPLHPCGHCG